MTPSSHIHNLTRFGTILVAIGTVLGNLKADQAQKHWAFQAISRQESRPSEGGQSESRPIDNFIQLGLQTADLSQNSTADRHTLLRRATLDLTGLPPTREEIANFVSDESPKAWETLVDRLLDSPHYGERWGRHWLDVARYVQGTIKVPGIDKIDLAEPYRDYVVRSFNEDKPYDRFIAEQLAGDLLTSDNESRSSYLDRITAPAFLSIGQWYDECTDPNKLRLDIIDEQISTATRAFLALDFACARCHDHKFDPIPTEDYYALAGIFRSTEITSSFAKEWKDGRPRATRPLSPDEALKPSQEIHAQIESLNEKRFAMLERFRIDLLESENFEKTPTLPDEILTFEAENFAGHKNLKTIALGEGSAIATRKYLDQWVKYRLIIPGPGDYTLLIRYAANQASPVKLEIEQQILPDRILGEPTFSEDKEGFRWTSLPLPGLKEGSFHIRFLVDRDEPFPTLDTFRLVAGAVSETELSWRYRLGPPTLAETTAFLNEDQQQRINSIEGKIFQLEASLPDIPVTLAIRDAKQLAKLPIHVGGDIYQTDGEPIPRGHPSLADHLIDTAISVPEDASGRAQFAEWLTHPDNPLTARVMVNRIWHGHFGTGLVRTVDDFGIQGAKPTHAELLDWLAAEFIESGWSVKHIHRLIMTSATYQASSEKTPESLARDPDGRLLSRFPGRRLEVEALYDGMTTSIGKVKRQSSGQPLDTNLSRDRALYILVSSRSPVGLGLEIRKMFTLFGFDDSGRPMHDRDESLSPQQSLFWLNNPLPRYYAEKLAANLITDHTNLDERITALYETLLGRPPEPISSDAIHAYLEENIANQLSETEAWTRVCLGLFSTHAYSHLE